MANKEKVAGGVLDRVFNGMDNLIGRISPEAGLNRARAQAKTHALKNGIERIKRYEAATNGRRTSGWSRPGSSANTEIGPALDRLRAGARDLVRNNPWASKAVRLRSADVIGTGIKPTARSGKSKRQAKKIDAAWKGWAGTTVCDPAGTKTFYKLQDLSHQAMDESGGVLIRRRFRPLEGSRRIPLQLQIYEADHIDTARDGYETTSGNRLIQGVEYDAFDRRVAFWLFPDHPGERYHVKNLVSERVPASEIIHLYEELRPGQVRGVPRGSSCLLRTRDFDDFEDAVLMRQKIANLYAGFIHDIDSHVETGAKFKEADIDEMEPGIFEHLPAGRTVTLSSPPHAEGYSDYSKISLRAIAAGWGVTYEALTGDLTQVNFTSARVGRLQYERSVEMERENTIIPILCHRVWQWFLQAGVIAGEFSDQHAEAVWTGSGREMVDPGKEIKAKVTQIQNGLTTMDEAVKSITGRPLREVLEELAEEKEMAESLGLNFECFTQAATAAQNGGSGHDPDQLAELLELIQELHERDAA